MLIEEVKNNLNKVIIPFWKKLRDDQYGGYYGLVDFNLKAHEKAIKGCILNSRILWFFSNAYQLLQEDSLLDEAKHAYQFMKQFCIDKANGGIYWSLNYEGTIFDNTKHTYNQAFAIYALSSYYDVSKDKEALNLAWSLYDIVEEKCRDSNGYREAFSETFVPVSNEKLSENGVIAQKTMNTLLHVFEAYTELYRITKEQKVADKLRWMLDIFADTVYNPEKQRQEVFFDVNWNSLIDLHSYGHDIEAAWLIDRGCELLEDEVYTKKIGTITKNLTQKIFQVAYDGHSLLNECENGVVSTTRIWWGQAEAMVGFLNGYQKDPSKTEYMQAVLNIWEFIKNHLIDPREGSEWFWEVDELGNPSSKKPIVEPWKCPYHNGRMCFEIIRRSKMLHKQYYIELEKYKNLINRNNKIAGFYNGIFDRWEDPILTRNHIPLTWRYDLDIITNPHFMERLGVNGVMNSGAIELNGKFYIVARIEGNDRKSFFGVAESENGVDHFEFWDYPILFEDKYPEETNVYDMRLTKHEDGYIYGVFCSESKDVLADDLSSAVATAGIVRTKDLKVWERLDNVTTPSPQQRNVVLHPEFVEEKYAFYTRPMDDFIDTGSGGGIGFGLCEDIEHATIDKEIITSKRKYHTITETKNGAGAVPIKTEKGFIHIAHGVRNTAAGLRYVIYAFATDLHKPWEVIAEPSGYLIAPLGRERVGDVSNVVFTNGAIAREDGSVYIYYASSDTRMHVATTTIDKLIDYVFHTPKDPLRSVECVKQRYQLIHNNIEILNKEA